MGTVIDKKTKQELLPFIRSHFSKLSQREMSRRLDIGKTTVNRWCRELGLYYKKHTSNESFFDKWNENSAYMLGYILTDGNIVWNPAKSLLVSNNNII